jgi:hypothetical protein
VRIDERAKAAGTGTAADDRLRWIDVERFDRLAEARDRERGIRRQSASQARIAVLSEYPECRVAPGCS